MYVESNESFPAQAIGLLVGAVPNSPQPTLRSIKPRVMLQEFKS
jgi:hypothetical protein